MDLGKPLVKYGAADITELRKNMQQLPAEFWVSDRLSRLKLAANRPGNAVSFYNDAPPLVKRPTHVDATSGFVNVLRYLQRPLFAEIQTLIDTRITPLFPACDVLRVQLVELPPGGIIKPHRDVGILALSHRLHIPIVTHERVTFIVAGQNFFLTEGTLYDLNNVAVHSVENRSHIMRIHLLVDMMPHSVARARYHDTEESMTVACRS